VLPLPDVDPEVGERGPVEAPRSDDPLEPEDPPWSRDGLASFALPPLPFSEPPSDPAPEPEPEPEPASRSEDAGRSEDASRSELEPDPPSELAPEPAPVAAPSAEPAAAADADRRLVLRSFFAQPLPLKWIVGAENALRTGAAPQIAQTAGPSAVTEWMTSNRWPFGQR
jgi:hypothetical protein